MRRSRRQTAFPIFLAPASWMAGLSLASIGLVRRDPLIFDFLRSISSAVHAHDIAVKPCPMEIVIPNAPVYERAAVTNGPPSITLNPSSAIPLHQVRDDKLRRSPCPKDPSSPKPFATSLCIWRVIRRRTPCRQQPQAFPECFRRELRFWPVHQLSRSGWSLTIFE